MKVLEEVVMPYNTGKAFIVKKGQRIRVIARSVVDCVVFNLDNLRERSDQATTKVHNGKIFISTGDQLYSKLLNRPMMTIVEDTYKGRTDLQYGTCNKLGYDRFWEQAKAGHSVMSRTWGKYLGLTKREDLPDHGCWENMQDALKGYDIAPEDIPSPLDLFQNKNITGPTGEISRGEDEFRPESGKPAHTDLRAEMNCLVVLSACPETGRGEEVKVQVFDK